MRKRLIILIASVLLIFLLGVAMAEPQGQDKGGRKAEAVVTNLHQAEEIALEKVDGTVESVARYLQWWVVTIDTPNGRTVVWVDSVSGIVLDQIFLKKLSRIVDNWMNRASKVKVTSAEQAVEIASERVDGTVESVTQNLRWWVVTFNTAEGKVTVWVDSISSKVLDKQPWGNDKGHRPRGRKVRE